MPLQLSSTVRDSMLEAIELVCNGQTLSAGTGTGGSLGGTFAASPIMRIRTGTVPANCAAADSGTVVATITLPADWLAAASGGTKALSGTWQDLSADATGTAAHFRIYNAAGTTCHLQGTVTATGGGGDLQVDNTSFATGQRFDVTAFTITAGNA